MIKPVPVITIDGPSGSGKGTVAALLACKLGWNFLDSGALYRLLAFAARNHGVDLTNDKERSEWLPDDPIREQLRFEDRVIKKQKQTPLCTWLYRTAFVNWDLGVSPCCNYYTGEKNHDFGNLKEETFSNIWQGKRYAAARRIFKDRSTNFDGVNICHRCIVKREQLRKTLQHQPEVCRDPKTCS